VGNAAPQQNPTAGSDPSLPIPANFGPPFAGFGPPTLPFPAGLGTNPISVLPWRLVAQLAAQSTNQALLLQTSLLSYQSMVGYDALAVMYDSLANQSLNGQGLLVPLDTSSVSVGERNLRLGLVNTLQTLAPNALSNAAVSSITASELPWRLLSQFTLRDTNSLSWLQAYQTAIPTEGWIVMAASLSGETLDQRGLLLEADHSNWSAHEQDLRLSLLTRLMAVMPASLRQSVSAALMPLDQNSGAVTAPPGSASAPLPAFPRSGGGFGPPLAPPYCYGCGGGWSAQVVPSRCGRPYAAPFYGSGCGGWCGCGFRRALPPGSNPNPIYFMPK
jgi:hypothetical protein